MNIFLGHPVHDFFEKKLYPDLKFILFFKKDIRSEIEKVVSYMWDTTVTLIRAVSLYS